MPPTPTPQQQVRQRTILAFLAAYIKQHGFPPTVREVADATGYHTSTTHKDLRRLALSGYITTTPHKYRSVRLTQKGWDHADQKETPD